LPDVLNLMDLDDAAFGLRISELLALQWQDLDVAKRLSSFAAS
jgi:integrase